jgi:inorganic pyrophosphatase
MINEPTFPGCVIQARPIGMFRMLDRGAADDKILAVPIQDPMFSEYHDITDIPQHFLQEVAHFFEVYKDLEGAHTHPIGWESADTAMKQILYSMELYREKFNITP